MASNEGETHEGRTMRGAPLRSATSPTQQSPVRVGGCRCEAFILTAKLSTLTWLYQSNRGSWKFNFSDHNLTYVNLQPHNGDTVVTALSVIVVTFEDVR